jgi:hypothetical protein
MTSRGDKMSAGNNRAAYMWEYRKRKRLEEDNCNNVPDVHIQFAQFQPPYDGAKDH